MPKYLFRDIENRPQSEYDELDKQRFYAEDLELIQQYINELEARITALEEA